MLMYYRHPFLAEERNRQHTCSQVYTSWVQQWINYRAPAVQVWCYVYAVKKGYSLCLFPINVQIKNSQKRSLISKPCRSLLKYLLKHYAHTNIVTVLVQLSSSSILAEEQLLCKVSAIYTRSTALKQIMLVLVLCIHTLSGEWTALNNESAIRVV